MDKQKWVLSLLGKPLHKVSVKITDLLKIQKNNTIT